MVSKSRFSLNISLNGELNMRVFESTQNGAILLTDELSEFSGLQLFFQDGESMVTFKDPDTLIEKLGYYSKHGEEVERIAAQGQSVTNRQFSFGARREAFFSLLNNGETHDAFRLKDEPRCKIQATTAQNKNGTLRRIQIYEVAQEIHRTTENPRIVLAGGATPFIASDLADLVRLQQGIAIDEEAFDQKIQPLMDKLGVRNLSRISPDRLSSEKSDLLILSGKAIDDLDSNLGRNHPTVCIWDFDPDDQTAESKMNSKGYKETGEHLRGLFELEN